MLLSESKELPPEILEEFRRLSSDPNYGVRWKGRPRRKVDRTDKS